MNGNTSVISPVDRQREMRGRRASQYTRYGSPPERSTDPGCELPIRDRIAAALAAGVQLVETVGRLETEDPFGSPDLWVEVPEPDPVRTTAQLDIPHVVRTGSKVAYIDLDGVICNDQHRVHHALERDWGSYFTKMVSDTPWRQGRDLYESAIMTGWDIAFLTGRREDTRHWTVTWLQQHGFDHTLPLVMRPTEQRMPLANLKALVVAETLRYVPEVILYDDDPEVISAVNAVQGAQAVHCTWHVKQKALIKKAQF